MPGDIVLGDRDGVIVIPRKRCGGYSGGSQKYAALDAGKVEATKTAHQSASGLRIRW